MTDFSLPILVARYFTYVLSDGMLCSLVATCWVISFRLHGSQDTKSVWYQEWPGTHSWMLLATYHYAAFVNWMHMKLGGGRGCTCITLGYSLVPWKSASGAKILQRAYFNISRGGQKNLFFLSRKFSDLIWDHIKAPSHCRTVLKPPSIFYF
jgi:hypothetical protein